MLKYIFEQKKNTNFDVFPPNDFDSIMSTHVLFLVKDKTIMRLKSHTSVHVWQNCEICKRNPTELLRHDGEHF